MFERGGLAVVAVVGLAFGLPGQPPGGPTPNGPPTVPDLPRAVPTAPTPPQAGGTSGQPQAGGLSGGLGGFGGQLPGFGGLSGNTGIGGLIGAGVGGLGGSGGPGQPPRPPVFVPATTPARDCLPTPPKVAPARPVLIDDLTRVPEVAFAERPAKDVTPSQVTQDIAKQLAQVTHLNAKQTDGFLAALLDHRPDLRGLPFVLGDACRTTGERTKQFTAAVGVVRAGLQGSGQPLSATTGPGGVPVQLSPSFWQQLGGFFDQHDAARPRGEKAAAEQATLARLAALTQMLPPESAEYRSGLVKYLTGVSHPEATRHLARLAIFSTDEEVRQAAFDALRVRREKDYTDILVTGLRYPWPAVAKRAADAVAKLERTDLVPELVKVLDEPDPRLPKTTAKGTTVRELVKINHHRNCLLCHPSGSPGQVPAEAITAEVPIPGQPLPSLSQGYGRSQPELMVRVDVTYLRGDFSATLPVPDAHPWPDQQRFDFVVRERALSAAEADAFEAGLTITEPGVLSPYHKAALAALRDLTGKDTAPTAEAWRKLLKLK